MAWQQVRSPRLGTKDYAGWCLRFVQAVFAAVAMHPDAWQAWLHQKGRRTTRAMPNVAVAVWFSHWGTYNGVYKNWGHVVVWVPGRGYLSSPGGGYGAQWFPNIGAVEAFFGAKFVGWTPYVHTTLIARWVAAVKPKPKPKPTPKQKGFTVIKKYELADKHSEIGDGRALRAGDHVYLNVANGRAASATNCVGGIGEYLLFPHLRATGRPGDAIVLTYMWQDTRAAKRSNSPHYEERLVFDDDGRIDANRAFTRQVPRGYAVYLQARADERNKGVARLTLLRSQALLIQ